jgi:hypothetical protein
MIRSSVCYQWSSDTFLYLAVLIRSCLRLL